MSILTPVDLQIRPYERLFENHKWDSDEADIRVLTQAAECLSERVYTSDDGVVRVRFDWSPVIEWRRLDAERNAHIDPDAEEPPEELAPVDVTLTFVDERDGGDAYHLHSFIELFLHESFLMLNVAVPGSFGGRTWWSWARSHRGTCSSTRASLNRRG